MGLERVGPGTVTPNQPRPGGGVKFYRQRSQVAAVPVEEPDFAAAHGKAPLVHLLLPKDHATLLVQRDDGDLEPHVPTMQALQQVGEMERRAPLHPQRLPGPW